jgi:hypothetical protein
VLGTLSAVARQLHPLTHSPTQMLWFADVHHGNGTQDMFYDDPDVLFVSMHQAGEDIPIYPNSLFNPDHSPSERGSSGFLAASRTLNSRVPPVLCAPAGSYPNTGKAAEVGEGAGEGTTINVPVPGLTGDSGVAALLDEVLAPALQRFQPDIILVRCLSLERAGAGSICVAKHLPRFAVVALRRCAEWVPTAWNDCVGSIWVFSSGNPLNSAFLIERYKYTPGAHCVACEIKIASSGESCYTQPPTLRVSDRLSSHGAKGSH